MDGPHDLGGKEGFGPVNVTEPEQPFHADWEARMWGVARAMRQPPDWNIDWFRHCRELIEPADYLSRPYFDQWMQDYAAMLVDSKLASVAEVASGKLAVRAAPSLGPAPGPEVVAAARSKRNRFDRDIDSPPAYQVDDRVRCVDHGHRGHTRLPAYARGRSGVVYEHHGAHVFPDANARGEEHAEALYTVAFDAGELWPEAAGRREQVFIDLWESYLLPDPAKRSDG